MSCSALSFRRVPSNMSLWLVFICALAGNSQSVMGFRLPRVSLKTPCLHFAIYVSILTPDLGGDEIVLPRVRVCSDGPLCCDDEPQCCSSGNGVFIDDTGETVNSTPMVTYSWGPDRTTNTVPMGATTRSTTTTTPTTTTTSASSSFSPTTSDATQTSDATEPSDAPDDRNHEDGSSDSTALKVGLGAGIPLAAILGALAMFWFFQRRSPRSKASQPSELGNNMGQGIDPKIETLYYQQAQPAREHRNWSVGEMDGDYVNVQGPIEIADNGR